MNAATSTSTCLREVFVQSIIVHVNASGGRLATPFKPNTEKTVSLMRQTPLRNFVVFQFFHVYVESIKGEQSSSILSVTFEKTIKALCMHELV